MAGCDRERDSFPGDTAWLFSDGLPDALGMVEFLRQGGSREQKLEALSGAATASDDCTATALRAF